MSARGRGQRGQATPLWAVVVVLACLLVFPSAQLIRLALDRAEARAAADAAALGAALVGPRHGRDEAELLADLNGAELIDYEFEGMRVTVTVQVGDVRATARAEQELVRVPSTAVPERFHGP